MDPILFQIIIPFILSSVIVILITIIAERYGTKVGGILGTLPSTIVVIFIFISLIRDLNFASKSVSVVPAEMGINMLFLFFFSIFIKRNIIIATIVSLTLWALMSAVLFLLNLTDIFISIIIYGIILAITFLILEYKLNVESTGKVKVVYTTQKIILRGLLAGVVVAIAVLLSNVNAVLSGIFSVFPAIFLSTMLISAYEHGQKFVGGMAKALIIGTISTTSYAVAIHFLYPPYGIILGSPNVTQARIAVVRTSTIRRPVRSESHPAKSGAKIRAAMKIAMSSRSSFSVMSSIPRPLGR